MLQILIDKCLGRRVCKHCKRNYNVAEINIPASPGRPAIYMPPLEAPPECAPHLMQRDDDNLDTVLHRLQVSCKAPTGRSVKALHRHRKAACRQLARVGYLPQQPSMPALQASGL